jgi:GGDEF domain-containing protein
MQPASKKPASKPTGQVTPEDCLLLLLRGIQNHAVIAGGADGQEFRAQLAALESKFQGKDNTYKLVDSAVEILDKYGTQTIQAIARQKSELAAAAEHWTTLEEQIKAISKDDDLEAVKARLTAQIATARAEALQVASSIEIPGAGPTADGTGHVTAAVHALDPLTGLPSRIYAEIELARAQGDPSDCFVALFVVKRLALINAKFGYSRGDQMLLKVVVHLAQSLPEFNNLFRWAPCAFLTVAPPKMSYKELRAKIQVIELTRMTPTLEWEGRSAMVPVVIDCRILSAKDFGTPSELFLRLDTLAADA